MSNVQKETFTSSVKAVLSSLKIEKSCCKKAYTYGQSVLADEFFVDIDRSLCKCPSCAAHLVRGIFMASGSVNAPDKGHHLEIKTQSKPRADELIIFLAEHGFEAKVSARRGESIVYFKDGDTIFAFLSFIGAQKCAFDFLEVMIEKQVRNDCNRKTNFDTANLAKTAAASGKHLEAIRYLEKSGELENLGDMLLYTAKLKLANPSVSLGELASLHEPPVTKSCVNHRLAKIVAEYEKSGQVNK